jgi:hypothetical protein
MSDGFDRQRAVMERSGLGLLPGIALAFVFALFCIAAILLQTWWATFLALGAVFVTAAAVIFVVWRLVLNGPETPTST